jgi:hypothetical protein
MNTQAFADVEYFMGALLVLVVFLRRFSLPPVTPSPTDPSAGVRGKIGQWFGSSKGSCALFPPPRANTTLFKYSLYQSVYAAGWVLIYILILKIPGLLDELQAVINLIVPKGPNLTILGRSGPVALAIMVAVLPRRTPWFRGADSAVRDVLYERAAIPAQQLRERSRLKNARYQADPARLDRVRTALVAERFNPEDIAYDEEATTRSLWTKASLLMEGIGRWQGEDRYTTAFAILKERDGTTLTVAVVNERYEALEGDAKSCFQALREAADEPETADREAAFRCECKALLEQIYDLLSRVSLKSHYSDRERVQAMNRLGFMISPQPTAHIPGHNDLVWLVIILGLVQVLPLHLFAGIPFVRAVIIGATMFVCVLTPLILLGKFPGLAAKAENGAPAITFPFLSAAIAMGLGVLISVGCQAVVTMDLATSWGHYTSLGYPWSFLIGLVAALIAWRMQTGVYPDGTQLTGFARFRTWGNLWDAAIFVGCTVALMILVVLRLLPPTTGTAEYLQRILLPAMSAFAVGFFIPTWYRAQVGRKDRRKPGSGRAEFQRKINQAHDAVRGRRTAG